MSYPTVDWTLSQLDSVVTDSSAPLKRVDQDESLLYDGDGTAPDMTSSIRKRKEDLQKANYIAAARTSSQRDPLGVGGHDVIQPIVRVQIEGLHHSDFGHVDPDGTDGVVFSSLVDDVKQALRGQYSSPGITDHDADFVRVYIENEVEDSHLLGDFYQAQFQARFVASETPA